MLSKYFLQKSKTYVGILRNALPQIVSKMNMTVNLNSIFEFRVETKMHFTIFPKMRKWNKFHKVSFRENF
jgi:hypothetical protein